MPININSIPKVRIATRLAIQKAAAATAPIIRSGVIAHTTTTRRGQKAPKIKQDILATISPGRTPYSITQQNCTSLTHLERSWQRQAQPKTVSTRPSCLHLGVLVGGCLSTKPGQIHPRGVRPAHHSSWMVARLTDGCAKSTFGHGGVIR